MTSHLLTILTTLTELVSVMSSSVNCTVLLDGWGSLFFSDDLGRVRLSNIMNIVATAVMSKMK